MVLVVSIGVKQKEKGDYVLSLSGELREILLARQSIVLLHAYKVDGVTLWRWMARARAID